MFSGVNKRVMFFAPPGSAKSTFVTLLSPPHLLARFPGCQIIGASHTAELADDFSAKIHGLIRDNERELGYGLASEARGRWYTTNGGAYLAAGVGAAIPGYRANFGFIDDPIKGRQAADSEADRKHVWDWYVGDFERRLTPEAPVILIQTRWHEDDLAGRLLASQPERWRVVSLPAQAEGDDDALGRSPGEWLWNDDEYGYGASLKGIRDGLEAMGASREWGAQYQQRPRPVDGSIFKIGEISVLAAVPAKPVAVIRAWDLAATKNVGGRDPDWTAGVKLARYADKRYVVLNVVRLRGGPDEIERLIVNTAAQDGESVKIGLPQDPGQAGKQQVAYLTKQLSGYTVESSPETGDKTTRASPVASQCNVGNLSIVEGQWNRPFLDELAAFPAGAHDDQVDGLSRGFGVIGLSPTPVIFTPEMVQRLQAQSYGTQPQTY